jgi:hypothetical protein
MVVVWSGVVYEVLEDRGLEMSQQNDTERLDSLSYFFSARSECLHLGLSLNTKE